MNSQIQSKSFRVRSFVRRNGRRTPAQVRAYNELWPALGLRLENGRIDFAKVFGRHAPCFLEIGFGSGQSLLAIAKAQQDSDFIGIETHQPGIGALLLGAQLAGIENLRVYDADAIEVLEHCIPNDSLAGVQIFFPDPWPKRKHHLRRLIQPDFLQLILKKLKLAAELHLATDWEDYAKQMLRVLSQERNLINLAPLDSFAERSPFRPIETKFERRALREGRLVFELRFKREK